MISQDSFKKKLPDTPGVYFFLGKAKKILYIGRATSLRNRVRSYFTPDLAEKRSSWIAKMLTEARSVDFKKTDSVLEAVFLEADLIKKFQPPYNTDEKDDKSFNCIVVTEEDFPALLIERSRNVDFDALKLRTSNLQLSTIYGPFTNGFQLQTAMKIIRRIFPYRDMKCKPVSSVSPLTRGALQSSAGGVLQPPAHPNASAPFIKGDTATAHPCFNRQIGLCPGTCTGEISKAEYGRTIRNLRLFFQGKKTRLLGLLQKEMKKAAKAQEFERAGEIKKTIFALKHIQDVALLKRESLSVSVPRSSSASVQRALRIEAYDLSHFGGKNIVGAMAVVDNGVARPSEYRLFKVRGTQQAHETAGLKEILTRRFNHPEWRFPNLVVVDGNEVQKRAAEEILRERGHNIPVVAVVKDEKHRPKKLLGERRLGGQHRSDILLANSEAHRFVLKFQRRQRGMKR